MLRVGNFIPAISLEGFEEANDSRRGEGVYDKVTHAMALLKQHHLPFGISACYTSVNYKDITSEKFYDLIMDLGAYFVWFFHYMPVGNDAAPELMPNPEQRAEVYRRIRAMRRPRASLPWDFQNDAEYVGGCIVTPPLPAHQRQWRRGSLRVHPLLRLQHPGEEPAGVPAIPHVHGLP